MSKNAAYDECIDKLLAEPERNFSPFAEYDADGDCIEFFMKPDPFFAERIDGLLTVYRSQENKEIVGAQIKRVTALCEEILGKFPGFRVEVHEGKMPLVHIFRVGLWLSVRGDADDVIHIYRFLTQKAEEYHAEVADGLFSKAV
jgi:hypothetical protein